MNLHHKPVNKNVPRPAKHVKAFNEGFDFLPRWFGEAQHINEVFELRVADFIQRNMRHAVSFGERTVENV